MTSTDDIIDRLAREGIAAQPFGAGRFAGIIAAGCALCLVLLAATLGAPFAALPEVGGAPYAMKLAFAISVAGIGTAAAFAAAVPGLATGRPLLLLAVPFLAAAVMAVLEIAASEPAWPGGTWTRCLAAIVILGSGVFYAIIYAMRRLAPTRPRVAGGAGGIAAGGVAASAYAAWCPETTALFLLNWYALPIMALGLFGVLAGPRLLRW